MVVYQSHTALNTTMVITALPIVKVWLKDSKGQIMLTDSSTVALMSGILMLQLVVILVVTILVNLCVMHYQTITHLQVCLHVVGSLFTMAQRVQYLSQDVTSLNATSNSAVRHSDILTLD